MAFGFVAYFCIPISSQLSSITPAARILSVCVFGRCTAGCFVLDVSFQILIIFGDRE